MNLLVSKDIYSNSDTESLKSQKQIIKEWEPQHEVWPLKYGSGILSCFSAVTGFVCNSIFRRSVRLMNHGYYSTTFLVMLGPAFVTYITHQYFIERDMLLYRTKCSLCAQMKATATMTISGFVYPLIVAPTISLPLAADRGLRVPYIYEVKELAKYFKLVLLANRSMLVIMLIGNATVASVITFKQFQSMKVLKGVLTKIQNYIDNYNSDNLEYTQ